jgi:hypothetical protein
VIFDVPSLTVLPSTKSLLKEVILTLLHWLKMLALAINFYNIEGKLLNSIYSETFPKAFNDVYSAN